MFNHVGQCTTDLDRATRFYVELLGFVVEREMEIPDRAASPLLGVDAPVGLRARYLHRDGFTLELMTFDRPGNPDPAERVMNEPGLTHLSLSVEDFEGTVERVEALGGQVLVHMRVAAMIRDPDGQRLEILTKEYYDEVTASRSTP